MNRNLKWLGVVVAGAILVHYATVWAIPRVIMSRTIMALSGAAGVNAFFHPLRADQAARRVVRPSPDLAYSICIIDLSEGPVRITVPVADSYASLALYSDVTDNFYVTNDQDVDGDTIEILVTRLNSFPVQKPASFAGLTIVESPSNTALALVRRVILSDAHFEEMAMIRQQETCASF